MIRWFLDEEPTYRRTFGAKRPSKKTLPPERHHNGVDIMNVGGELVYAPEPATVVRIHGWTKKPPTVAIVLATDGGVWVIGGFVPESVNVVEGVELDGGEPLGRIDKGYDQAHIERWAPGTRRSRQWVWGEEPPEGLLVPYMALDALAEGHAPPGVTEAPSDRPSPADPNVPADPGTASSGGAGALAVLGGVAAVLSIGASMVALASWQSKSKSRPSRR